MTPGRSAKGGVTSSSDVRIEMARYRPTDQAGPKALSKRPQEDSLGRQTLGRHSSSVTWRGQRRELEQVGAAGLEPAATRL